MAVNKMLIHPQKSLHYNQYYFYFQVETWTKHFRKSKNTFDLCIEQSCNLNFFFMDETKCHSVLDEKGHHWSRRSASTKHVHLL